MLSALSGMFLLLREAINMALLTSTERACQPALEWTRTVNIAPSCKGKRLVKTSVLLVMLSLFDDWVVIILPMRELVAAAAQRLQVFQLLVILSSIGQVVDVIGFIDAASLTDATASLDDSVSFDSPFS